MESLLKFLNSHWVFCIGTSGPEGLHTTPLWYALDCYPLQFIFLSNPKSRHLRDIFTRPEAAAAVFEMTREPTQIRGAQLRGKIEFYPDYAAAKRLYLDKFPDLSGVLEQFPKHRFAKFQPHWARLIDNSHASGYPKEWDGTAEGGLW